MEIVAISAARILHTAVAVMNHALARLGHSAGAPDRSQRSLYGQALADLVADNAA